MTCPRLEETSALFDGALGDDAAAAARAHVDGCAECRAFDAHMRRVRDALREPVAFAAAPAPRALWRRRIAIPLPVALLLFALLVALLLPRRAARETGAFDGFDAGRAPVVVVRSRGAR
ncbi:MAG: zf-HC2 domain-containing protein [Acidobacteria bacterium]|nr:zf-HC2 domain-containing protein [Acidobacteriota bacterium]MBV9476042.1 zf-HC2 domain-containing protein [Acidobacteriota bacterium]